MATSQITLADALEEAQRRIADAMQHPDSLNTKLALLKSRLSQEKLTIDAVLKTSVQQQLNDIQSGMQTLSRAEDTIKQVKTNLGTIDQVCLDAKATITNYSKIKRVSRDESGMKM